MSPTIAPSAPSVTRAPASVWLLLLAVTVAACGTVDVEPTAKDGAGGNGAADVGGSAGGAGGAAGEIGGAGEAGHAGASGLSGSSGGTSSAGAGGGASSGGSSGEAGHPAIADCPRPIAAWGTQCPNKYPDGSTCVLGCIYDNSGQTYEPAGGACYIKSDSSYGKPFVCLPYNGGLTTCASCPR